MRPIDDSVLTPDERLSEVATILAGGIVRLHARAALPAQAALPSAPGIAAESAALGLEVFQETVLSVHNG